MKIYIVILKDIGGKTDQRFYYLTKEKAKKKQRKLEKEITFIKPTIEIKKVIVK